MQFPVLSDLGLSGEDMWKILPGEGAAGRGGGSGVLLIYCHIPKSTIESTQ